MELKILYFAAARELSGRAEEILHWPGSAAGAREVLAELCARHPALGDYGARMGLAVNEELLLGDAPVKDGDVISILPPVAGGAPTLCAIRNTPLSTEEATAAVQHAGAGGLCLFVGVVRDHADGQPVEKLAYEAHPTLAEREMADVLAEVCAEVPGTRLAAVHRVGTLSIGETAVVVAASAPHRDDAFRACRLAIDRIKQRVPIWKKEWWSGGQSHWVNLDPAPKPPGKTTT